MAKAISLFVGSDSTGRNVELAQAVHGKWYVRFYIH